MSAAKKTAAPVGDDDYADDFDPICNMNHATELAAQKAKIEQLEAQLAKLGGAPAPAPSIGVSGVSALPPTPLGRRRLAGGSSDSKTPAVGGGGGGAGGSGGLGFSLSDYKLREIPFKDLSMGDQIAGGGFCTLHKSSWMTVTVAVKKIFDPIITAELKAEFHNECAMLSNLRHPNIVQILGACSLPPTLAIVTEFMARGSLYHVLHQDSKLSLTNDRKKAIALQTAQGLWFISENGVVHRDIKSYNVLLDEHLRVKICDFGLARVASTAATATAATNSKEAEDPAAGGTPSYMAPELWAKKPFSSASDVYAFGVLLYEIWERSVPWDGYSVPDIREKVMSGARPCGESLPKKPSMTGAKCGPTTENMPDEIHDLITACWDAKPEKRPTFGQIVQKLLALWK